MKFCGHEYSHKRWMSTKNHVEMRSLAMLTKNLCLYEKKVSTCGIFAIAYKPIIGEDAPAADQPPLATRTKHFEGVLSLLWSLVSHGTLVSWLSWVG